MAEAEVVNAPELAVLKERRAAFEARVKSSAEATSIAGRLRENPQDVAARGQMLTLQLIELDQLTMLKTLDLRRCDKISAEDVENLAKRLPDCKVQWGGLTSR